MSGFFLTDLAGMSGIGVIEGFAINVLRVFRQQPLKVLWKIRVALLRHHDTRPTKHLY